RSPGYPLFNPNLIKAKKAGVEISSPMKLFFQLCPTKNIIGVTGSKGKGTTSSLVYEILKKATITPNPSLGRRGIFLGGNIGTAPFEFLEKIKPKDWVVLELSSFQLEDMDVSPHIAVVTNLFKEHLAPADPNNPNYHNSIKNYWAAKANIFAHQENRDWLVMNEKLKSKLSLRAKRSNLVVAARHGIASSLTLPRNDRNIIFYDKSELASNLTGEHNKENVAATEAVAKILKIKPAIIAQAVKKFQGLPHRLEFVAEINGVKYFDDSFATVPDVSVIALKAVGDSNNTPRPRGAATPLERGIILLAGGADKGSDFKNFAREIIKHVKYLILFKGKGTDRLIKQISNFKSQISVVDNMKAAVRIAKNKSAAGDTVLLSTG
ncbi:MAG TPA: UDP-N-acetylmuramoyl-L-alanine--D-glutamate ligase, partial [Candidatus Methylomirabilis sp.]|nr:UDP-N-acetylmuramoyl-L-alanine--D-glutamate ligase [Candidatus Methylomirabilis sp.]